MSGDKYYTAGAVGGAIQATYLEGQEIDVTFERISVQYVIFLELFELIWNFFGKLKCFDLQNDLHSVLSVSTHFMTIFDEKT